MNKMYFLIGFLLLGSLLSAQFMETNFQQTTSTTDNILGPVINPAFIGMSGLNGLGWMHYYDSNKFQDHYWLLVNMKDFSYVYEKNEQNQNFHKFTIGSEMKNLPASMQNLYWGMTYGWMNGHTNERNLKSGLLYRPANSMSFSFVLDNVYKESPAYNFGMGIRPFALIPLMKPYRLDLSVDVPLNKNINGEDYEFNRPILGLSTQLFDGIKLKGTYDLEAKTTMLSIGINAFKSESGSMVYYEKANGKELKESHGVDYIFSPKEMFSTSFIKPAKQWYNVPVSNQIVTYKSPKYNFGPFKIFDQNEMSVEELITNINKAEKDPAVKGLIFIKKNFVASLALKQEIVTAINDFKKTGKKVVFYYEGINNGDYVFAAAVADKIYLNPNGSVDLKGLSINSPYLKDMLDKIGITVYNFRSHPYKTAGNMFSENGMTPEERAEYESLLGDLYAQACQMIQDGRGGKLRSTVTQTIDAGPYFVAEDALKAGLVDSLIYEDQLDKVLKKEFAFSGKQTKLEDYQDVNWYHAPKTKIAVIYAQGNIVGGKGQIGRKIAQETTVENIRRVRKDSRYKGIILRVDSGGGSAVASDIINREIELAKKENKMPVVVSMTGVAASGGYYISLNADKIIADPATLTGSIGVIGISFSAENLFKKLYVNWSQVKKGENSDFGNMTRPMLESEKKKMQHSIEAVYHSFVSKVAAGRGMQYDAVDKLAKGQVWTGIQGKKNGLVDELGGLKEAAQAIKEIAKIKNDIELVNTSNFKQESIVKISVDPKMSILGYSKTLQTMDEFLNMYEPWLQYQQGAPLMLPDMNLEQISK